MSQHQSLKVAGKMVKQRQVLKRYERLNLLKSQGKEIKSAYNLPKVRIVKTKVRKIKDDKEEELNPTEAEK